MKHTVKNNAEIEMRGLPSFLSIYKNADILVAYKARFIFYFSLTCISGIATIFIYTVIIQIKDPALKGIQYPVLAAEICALALFCLILFFLKKGYFIISSHLIIITGLLATWSVLFLDRSHLISRLDSVVFIFALLSMTPLLIHYRSSVVVIYSIVNLPVLAVFLISQRQSLVMPLTAYVDYFADVGVALVILAISTYNIFIINRMALYNLKNDISKREAAEEALRHSEELYRGLFSSMREGFILYRIVYDDYNRPADVIFVDVNPVFEKISAIPRELFIGKSVNEVPLKHLISMTEEFILVGEEGVSRRFEWDEPDGEHNYEIMMFSPGKGLVATLVMDITDRKKNEEKITSLLRFQNEMLETAAIWINTLDINGNVLTWNKAAERISGYSKEEVIGHNSVWKWLYPDELYRNLITSKSAEIIRGGGRIENYETTIRTKKGEERIISWHSNNLFNEGGTVAGSIALAADVTEMKKNLEEKEKLEVQIRHMQKMESIGRLAGGIAHDFNNLLTAILGTADLALINNAPGDKNFQRFTTIKTAAESAANLTRQLLAFSRKQVIEPRVLDLAAVMDHVHDMLSRMIGENIDLRIETGQNTGMIKADLGQIEQVLINLAVNARDAMPEGGTLLIETGNVYFSRDYSIHHPAVDPGDYVMIAVSDTGIGMSPEIKQYIFEPFFTTKETGKGTGLGLATVYGIVRQSGGMIDCYSESGHGTTFRIYFPLVEEEPGLYTDLRTSHEITGGTETILVVEDNIHVLDFVSSILSQLGYNVITVLNGEEAISISESYKDIIHLLMTDVILPGINGKILAERIKELRPDIRILYNSGYSGDLISRSGILEDGIHFISKPFTAHDLAAKMREILDRE